jgi:hypothetical protein
MVVDKLNGYNINDGTDMKITEAFMRELGISYGYQSFFC